MTMDERVDGQSQGRKRMPRRALLKRAGSMLAVAGGAAAASQAMAGTAQAADGDTLIIGQVNVGGTGTTSLTSSSSTGSVTLAVGNTGTYPPFALTSSDPNTYTNPNLSRGEMWQVDGTLFFVPVGSETLGGPIPAIVSNEMNSTQIVPIAPQRVLDTRTPAGRAHIVDLGALDSAGRLRADVWMHLDLTSLGSIFSAVVANLTVTGTTGTGWVAVTAVPTGPPSTSAINFTRGQTVANGLTSGVDPNAGTVSFWANMATHVIFDVTALNAPSPRYVPGALATPSSVRFQRAHAEMIARTSG
jgi:hypothetical protein